MKLSYFKKTMQKQIFTATEAKLVAFKDNPALVNLQLHQWKERGELLSLKRGLYAFVDTRPDLADIARALCSPCYFSLEYVLSLEGILPEVAFVYTLVTTRNTHQWQTPFGTFSFRTIKPGAFQGFNPITLMASPEKALVDYFYLNGPHLVPRGNVPEGNVPEGNLPKDDFWEESRLEALVTEVNFKKVFSYAKLFGSKKLEMLLGSFAAYAKSH